METLVGFILEHAIVNSSAIFPASLAIAYLTGTFLINAGVNNWIRIIIYSFAGVAGGLISYAYLTIPDRSIELMEGLYLSVGMLSYVIIPTAIIVLVKSYLKKRKNNAAS